MYLVWLHYVNAELSSGFSLDSLRNSHPIEVKFLQTIFSFKALQVQIENPNELDEISDQITNQKSSSVIRMLYTYLGETSLKKGNF